MTSPSLNRETTVHEFVLNFFGATEYQGATPGKIAPPAFKNLRNVEITKKGSLKTRRGFANWSVHATPDPGNAWATHAVSCIDPSQFIDIVAVSFRGTGNVYYEHFPSGAWQVLTTMAQLPGYMYARGYDPSGNVVLYLVNGYGGKLVSVRYGTGTTRDIGYDSGAFTSALGCAWFLDRLWVLGANSAGTLKGSAVGNDISYSASDSVSLNLRQDTSAIRYGNMAVYQNRLYCALGSELLVVTGETAASFGIEKICTVQGMIVSTLMTAGPYLFWVDLSGVWRYDGGYPVNVGLSMIDQWEDHDISKDLYGCTTSVDPTAGIYSILFPDSWLASGSGNGKRWNYYYNMNIWTVDTFPANKVSVLGTSFPYYGLFNKGAGLLGGMAGEVFVESSATLTDDGTTITSSIRTGEINLASFANPSEPSANAVVKRILIDAIPQSAGSYTITMTMTIDGTAQTAQTLTISAGSTTDTPRRSIISLPTHVSGTYHRFTITISDSNGLVRGELVNVIIQFETKSKY